MSMITKCPSCSTTFRVTPPQLQAQRGMVRCGRCTMVFDGFQTLATLRDDSPLEAKLPTEVLSAEPATPGAQPHPAVEIAPATPLGRAAPAIAEAPLQPAIEIAPAPAEELRSAAPRPEPEVPAQAKPGVAPEPYATFAAEAFAAETEPKRSRGGWAFGSVVLLIALVAQGAYFYRGEIASSVPELRPHLNRMCDLLRCTVALPQRPRQISIEASDMQAPDPAHPGQIALTATLRNQATIALGYPALDVVLTNIKDHTVARRIFLPAEYLDTGKDPRAGIPANAEVTVRLNLDSGDLGAAGFRLDLLAAPAR
jgi:predicted Zn finger-like uncharacterized protein